MSKNSSVVEVFDERSGDVKPYKLMSARLPDFLKEYPKSEGYQVKFTTTDMLHSKPGLIRLYEAAMAANMAPNQAGLPPLPDANIVIFTASLVDKDGKVLESASATRHLTGYPKEWEKGETAARQRLLAALGFGGDCFDDDEKADIAQLDTRPKSQPRKEEGKSQEAVQESGQKDESTSSSESDTEQSQSSQDTSKASDTDAASQPSTDTPAKAGPVKPAEKPAASKPAASKRKKSDDSDEDGVIPAHILRQIEHQAKLKNVDAPAPRNVKEAKEKLKELMRL